MINTSKFQVLFIFNIKKNNFKRVFISYFIIIFPIILNLNLENSQIFFKQIVLMQFFNIISVIEYDFDCYN